MNSGGTSLTHPVPTDPVRIRPAPWLNLVSILTNLRVWRVQSRSSRVSPFSHSEKVLLMFMLFHWWLTLKPDVHVVRVLWSTIIGGSP